MPDSKKPPLVTKTQDWPRSHYHFLDEHFDTILTRMGQADKIHYRGNFSASGDKYYSYRSAWESSNIPWFHGAAMYHLMELIYPDEIRQTLTGWVDPWMWVILNYHSGHNLSQYMEGLE